MDKKEVEQILIIVKSGQAEALNMKIYKNGIIARHGCGGLPQLGISGMSFTESSDTLDKLIDIVPQQILDAPIHYQDEKIETPLEYIIAFYGVSKNGDTGENAEWTKSTGIQLLIDTNTTFRHPILSFVDMFSMDAAEKTNSWYFDIIINAVYKLKSTTLPQTFLATPKTEQAIQSDFENYVNQMRYSARQWDVASFAEGKIYVDSSNKQFLPNITQKGDAYTFNFIPASGQAPIAKNESVPADHSTDTSEREPVKKWWKFW